MHIVLILMLVPKSITSISMSLIWNWNTVNLVILASIFWVMESEIQEFPDWRSSWKKCSPLRKASDIADEQMVNWRAGKKSKSNKLPAPGLEEWLCCQKPEGRSRQHFSLYKYVLQARYQSPSIQMRGWFGERKDKDWSTVAWCRSMWSSSEKFPTFNMVFTPDKHYPLTASTSKCQ